MGLITYLSRLELGWESFVYNSATFDATFILPGVECRRSRCLFHLLWYWTKSLCFLFLGLSMFRVTLEPFAIRSTLYSSPTATANRLLNIQIAAHVKFQSVRADRITRSINISSSPCKGSTIPNFHVYHARLVYLNSGLRDHLSVYFIPRNLQYPASPSHPWITPRK